MASYTLAGENSADLSGTGYVRTHGMTSTAFEDTRTAKVNGTTLAYRELGNGEPVVFVHGAVSDLRIWAKQLPTVGGSCRAITYSRRFARPTQDIEPGADDPWPQHVEDRRLLA